MSLKFYLAWFIGVLLAFGWYALKRWLGRKIAEEQADRLLNAPIVKRMKR